MGPANGAEYREEEFAKILVLVIGSENVLLRKLMFLE